MRGALVLALAAVLPGPGLPAALDQRAAPTQLRYDLRPGDHLVYLTRFERRARSARVESLAEAEWESHLLVVDSRDGAARIGVQRNRTRAELKRYDENGRDRLAEGRRELEQSLASRGVRSTEVNWVRPDGASLLPWSAVREWSSERLPFFHEVEPLPDQAVAPGQAFVSPGLLALPMRALRREPAAGEDCLRLEGEMAGGALRVRQWHCEASGTLGRLEFDARYEGPGGVSIEEHFRLERTGRSRGEALRSWLRDPATAQGALRAIAVLERLPVPPDVLHDAAQADDPGAQRLALAALWRHRAAAPSVERLSALAASPVARVRALAVRLLAQRTEQEAQAVVERAQSEADASVRAAARTRPAVDEALRQLAQQVRGGGPLPGWSAPLRAGIGRAILDSQLARAQVPGTTLRFMRDPHQEGRAYVLHVPDDYRGDEPFPLTIVLGGGPGRALPTAQVARDEVEARGALAVFPQANGMWWDEQAGQGMEALLRELLQELNVDTDRVTISGYSNGGTGTVLYASRLPDRFAAYVSLMGGGLPFFEQDGALDPAGFVHLPALFVHGERDEVIPSWASERTVKALRRVRADAPVELHLLRERPHDVRHGRDEGLTFPFLERAVRDPFPRRVALRARDLAHARAYWVEVLAKGGGTATVAGEIEGQAITLRTRGVKRLALHLRRELVDLAQPVTVRLDGREAFSGPVREDPALFLRSWRASGDPQLASGARLELDHP